MADNSVKQRNSLQGPSLSSILTRMLIQSSLLLQLLLVETQASASFHTGSGWPSTLCIYTYAVLLCCVTLPSAQAKGLVGKVGNLAPNSNGRQCDAGVCKADPGPVIEALIWTAMGVALICTLPCVLYLFNKCLNVCECIIGRPIWRSYGKESYYGRKSINAQPPPFHWRKPNAQNDASFSDGPRSGPRNGPRWEQPYLNNNLYRHKTQSMEYMNRIQFDRAHFDIHQPSQRHFIRQYSADSSDAERRLQLQYHGQYDSIKREVNPRHGSAMPKLQKQYSAVLPLDVSNRTVTTGPRTWRELGSPPSITLDLSHAIPMIDYYRSNYGIRNDGASHAAWSDMPLSDPSNTLNSYSRPSSSNRQRDSNSNSRHTITIMNNSNTLFSSGRTSRTNRYGGERPDIEPERNYTTTRFTQNPYMYAHPRAMSRQNTIASSEPDFTRPISIQYV